MKTYQRPFIHIVEIADADVLTESPGSSAEFQAVNINDLISKM